MDISPADLLARLGAGARPSDEKVAVDFGQRHTLQPKAVTDADDERAAIRALRVAAEAGQRLAIRGAGHSCGGQTLSNGIVLRSFSHAPEIKMLDENRVQVRGRTSWETLERFLNERGRSCPVLTDHLATSVGGTLSVGGAGLGSIGHGFQVDQIERLRLVLPDGSARECSAQTESELFGAALAGAGRVGYIENVVLRTVPRRRYAHLYLAEHAQSGELFALTSELARDPGGIEHFQGYGRARKQSELGYYSDTKERADDRLPPSVARRARYLGFVSDYPFRIGNRRLKFLESGRDCHRVWGDFFLTLANLGEFVRRAEPILARPVFATMRQVRYHLVIRRPGEGVAISLLPPRERGPLVGYGVYNMVPRGDAAVLRAVDEAMQDLLIAAADVGGWPYIYGDFRLDAVLLRRFFGTAYDRLQTLRTALGATRLGPAWV